jgi:superfamily I DNA/RNA helicase
MIRKEYGDISKRDINSLLYKMSAKGLTYKNDKYEWSAGQGPSKTEPEKANISILEPKNNAISPDATFQKNIQFSDEQKKVIGIDLNDSLLIRGQAGSGKTTVLAARAGRSLSVASKGTILFLTYNAALCKYVAKIFKSESVSNEITVSTYHEWAVKMAEVMGYKFGGWVQPRDRTDQIKAILTRAITEKGSHRLYDPKDIDMITWWNEEISWLFGQGIFDFEEYKLAERIGRGIAIRVPLTDREYVWYVYSKYLEWLKTEGKEDYDNVAGLVIKSKEQFGSVSPENLRFDHVFVDEVQDFDKSWLSVLAPIPRISLTMAGDIAQKIYKRNFTWKSVGIKIQAHRSVPLRGSFRTTKQIMRVGSIIIQNCQMQSDEEYVNPVMPIKQGPLINRLIRKGIKNAYDEGYKYVAHKFKRIRTSTVAVALPFSRQVYPAQKQLSSLGLKAKTAKGGSLGAFSSGIVVTNYHQLKGLEFDHVVLFGLDDQTFPGRYLDKILADDIQDEENVLRKLVYVAMTRAKETLTIVGGNPFCRFFDDVSDELFIDI